MVLILGIDDAGRGPIIGPMILAGVLIDRKHEEMLKKQGVADSKKVLHPKRIELAKLIREMSEGVYVAKSFPLDIDNALKSGTNLNTLEAMKTAECINALNQGKYQKEKIKIVIDCPSVNIIKWTETLHTFVKHPGNLEIACEHKADVNHVAVSAASIIAKCAREEEVEKLKGDFKDFGDIGSGYPADPITKEFLKKHGHKLKDKGIFRKTWATWKALFPGDGQSTLFK